MIIIGGVCLCFFLLSCYFCGFWGTFVFTQTLPLIVRPYFVERHPLLISFLFPVSVPALRVIPRGYAHYYWACCFIQTRRWSIIITWAVTSLIFCLLFSVHEVLEFAIGVYILKFFVVTPEMETIIVNYGNPFSFPLQYTDPIQVPHSYLSWLDLFGFTCFIASLYVSFFRPVGLFYVSASILVIVIWLFLFLRFKHFLLGRKFSFHGDFFLGFINMASVALSIVFAIFCPLMEKECRLGLFLQLSVLTFVMFSYNKVIGYFLSKLIGCFRGKLA